MVAKRCLGVENQGSLDEREVGECLREVAKLPESDRIVLLRQQPDIIAQVKETLEELARLVGLALQREYPRQPERARKGDSVAADKAVDAFLRPIAENRPSTAAS